MSRRLAILLILVALPCFAQQGPGNDCTIAGTWYGGSVVAYQMTIIPIAPAGRFVVITEPGFTDGKLSTLYSETVVKNGDSYEGGGIQFYSEDPSFATEPPTLGKLPDVRAVWSTMKLTDCNTLSNYIPFFGLYFSSGIWSGKTIPFTTPLDVDLVVILNDGKAIQETYHRMPTAKPPAELMHK